MRREGRSRVCIYRSEEGAKSLSPGAAQGTRSKRRMGTRRLQGLGEGWGREGYKGWVDRFTRHQTSPFRV